MVVRRFVDDQSYMLSAVPVWKFPSPNFGYTMCQTVVKSCVKVAALSGSCAYVNRETKYGWCQYVQLKRAEHQERTERTSWLPLQEASKLTSMMKHLQPKHSMGKGTLRWHYEQGLSSLPGNCRQRIGNNLVLISASKCLLGECPLDIASIDIHWTFPFLVTTEPTVEPFVSEMLSWEWFCMLVPARWNHFKVVRVQAQDPFRRMQAHFAISMVAGSFDPFHEDVSSEITPVDRKHQLWDYPKNGPYPLYPLFIGCIPMFCWLLPILAGWLSHFETLKPNRPPAENGRCGANLRVLATWRGGGCASWMEQKPFGVAIKLNMGNMAHL